MATKSTPVGKTATDKSGNNKPGAKAAIKGRRPAAKSTPKPKPTAKRIRQTERQSATAESTPAGLGTNGLSGVAGQLFTWVDKLGDIAGPVTTLALAGLQRQRPDRKMALKAAGMVLRQAREAVGMTAQELGTAINIKDAALLEQAETGRAALPIEAILRLAGILGRHDPISFSLKLTRSYYPDLWEALEGLGVGKLAIQAGREREFANLYRQRDAARRLNDEEFATLLTFVGSAFDMSLEFLNQNRIRKPARNGKSS